MHRVPVLLQRNVVDGKCSIIYDIHQHEFLRVVVSLNLFIPQRMSYISCMVINDYAYKLVFPYECIAYINTIAQSLQGQILFFNVSNSKWTFSLMLAEMWSHICFLPPYLDGKRIIVHQQHGKQIAVCYLLFLISWMAFREQLTLIWTTNVIVVSNS